MNLTPTPVKKLLYSKVKKNLAQFEYELQTFGLKILLKYQNQFKYLNIC